MEIGAQEFPEGGAMGRLGVSWLGHGLSSHISERAAGLGISVHRTGTPWPSLAQVAGPAWDVGVRECKGAGVRAQGSRSVLSQ